MVDNHRVLIINDPEVALIKSAIATARKRAYRWEVIQPHAVPIAPVMGLADRKGGVFPGVPVLLPTGYRATISFEYQPDGGLYRHLGISVEDADALPHPLAVRMIAEAFGFLGPPDRGWVEEFRPGHYAVHVIARELSDDVP